MTPAEQERAAAVAWLRKRMNDFRDEGNECCAVGLLFVAQEIGHASHLHPTRRSSGGQVMHKDLSEEYRKTVEFQDSDWALALFEAGQSLAIAREAWINAFDRAAEELEGEA